MRHLFILILSIFSFESFAQLKVGSKVPDIVISNVVNYKSSTLRLSDFRGKLLIIDFWNTGCKSCLKSFPKLDSLQKVFDGKIQVLVVTKEPATKIEKYYKDHPKLPKANVPSVTSDTILSQLFPHIYVPHHVWIGGDGIVQQVTSGYNTTFNTVKKYLAGEKLKLNQKTDIPYSSFRLPDAYDSTILSYSCLLKKIKGLKANNNVWLKDKGDTVGLHFDAASVVDLYKAVVAGEPTGGEWYNNRIIVEKEGSYFKPKDPEEWDDWYEQNTFRYTTWKKNGSVDGLFKKMHQELQEYFGLTVVVEKRRVNSLVLSCTDPARLRSAGGKSFSSYGDGRRFVSKNLPLNWFVKMLKLTNAENPLPIVNATNFNGMADLELEVSLSDIPALSVALAKKGLKLEEQVQEVEMLVLKPYEK